MPVIVDNPVQQLPTYDDGQKCILQPERCQYICRTQEGLRKHWRIVHQWKVGRGRGGGSGAAKSQAVQDRRNTALRRVRCQRLFAQGPHSRYFEVRQPETAPAEQEQPDSSIERTWTKAWARANKLFDEIQASTTIAEGEKDEVNPWLRRTGWLPYLKEIDREELLQSIRQPETEAE